MPSTRFSASTMVAAMLLSLGALSGSAAGQGAPAPQADAGKPVRTTVDFDRATLVSLHLQNESAQSAAHKLALQSGPAAPCRIVVVRTANAEQFDPVTLDLDNQPFLVALARLGADLHATLSNPYGSSVLQLSHLSMHTRHQQHVLPIENEISWLGGPSQSIGPLLVVVRSISRTTTADMEQPNTSRRTLNLALNVLYESQVRVVARAPWFSIQEAVDEKGNSLSNGATDTPPSQWFTGPLGDWEPAVALVHPEHIGTRIARLKGALRFRAVSVFDTIEMTAPTTGQRPTTVTLDGLVITLTPAPGGGGSGYRASFSVARGQLDEATWKTRKEMIAAGSRFRVLDTAGNSMPQYSAYPRDGADGTVIFALNYGRDLNHDGKSTAGPPSRVVWDAPVESRELALPVQFNDLPLP